MQSVARNMQADLEKISQTGAQLDACFAHLDSALAGIDGVVRQLERQEPHIGQRFAFEEVERLFSASYTTEIERDVMHAALRGTPLPVLQQSFAGNSVELF
jgi:hypothetical protein